VLWVMGQDRVAVESSAGIALEDVSH
jgi:hypothetical protein